MWGAGSFVEGGKPLALGEKSVSPRSRWLWRESRSARAKQLGGGGGARCRPPYRDTSLIRNRQPVGPYSRTNRRLLWRPWGGGRFIMREVPQYSQLLQSWRTFNAHPICHRVNSRSNRARQRYRGTLLIRKREPYRRPVPRVLGVS